MLSLAHGVKIFLYRQSADMRLGYEGLRCLAQNNFPTSPLSGHLFVFFNKGRNRCKILFYDRGGLCLFCKRLELGTFAIPDLEKEGHMEIDRVELLMFLDGIMAQGIKRKRRFSPS